MRRETYYYDYVYVIHDFFTPEECRASIAQAEKLGFVDAPITTSEGAVMRKDVRNNTRVISDDPITAERLWQRIQPWVIDPWRQRTAIGLNERLRYYKYEPGQSFAPHFDGRYRRNDFEKSDFTFLVYLNDDFAGGGTRFFKPGVFRIEPKAGSALLFHHPQLHEGEVVERGVKYVLRSDVMYRSTSPGHDG
ncbi:prolyl hydroxylase family protein [Blastopirellula marina]|uniref:Proline hydroxylase n=1 Tax=Blastopirellula marina TaxID=124 RepID=A0A2S8FX72_9BACT|nr:2OG-Fe(II) oxygenase [Blastopirellula marina]PQO36670.1 proline hydroxylase [Blastopirellula marina]PTL44500.1 proline hydroxylase [Blastopirellula marina]